MRRALAGMVIMFAVLASTAALSWAGTYTVLSCKDRAGQPAPANDAWGGWQPGTTGGLGLEWTEDCRNPSHGIQAAIPGTSPRLVRSQVWWRFVPPSSTLLEAVD